MLSTLIASTAVCLDSQQLQVDFKQELQQVKVQVSFIASAYLTMADNVTKLEKRVNEIDDTLKIMGC